MKPVSSVRGRAPHPQAVRPKSSYPSSNLSPSVDSLFGFRPKSQRSAASGTAVAVVAGRMVGCVAWHHRPTGKWRAAIGRAGATVVQPVAGLLHLLPVRKAVIVGVGIQGVGAPPALVSIRETIAV